MTRDLAGQTLINAVIIGLLLIWAGGSGAVPIKVLLFFPLYSGGN